MSAPELEMRVLFFTDPPSGMTVMIGRDHDIATQGKTLDICLDRFKRAVAAHEYEDEMNATLAEDDPFEPLSLLPAPPPVYQAMYDRGRPFEHKGSMEPMKYVKRLVLHQSDEPDPVQWVKVKPPESGVKLR